MVEASYYLAISKEQAFLHIDSRMDMAATQ